VHLLAEMAIATAAALVIGPGWFYAHIRRVDRQERFQKIMWQRRVGDGYWREFTQSRGHEWPEDAGWEDEL
jgi:hypothetical protein